MGGFLRYRSGSFGPRDPIRPRLQAQSACEHPDVSEAQCAQLAERADRAVIAAPSTAVCPDRLHKQMKAAGGFRHVPEKGQGVPKDPVQLSTARCSSGAHKYGIYRMA